MNSTGDDVPEPSEVELLMPWYAAGTLSPRDTKRVEDALANDPEFARRYRTVSDELGATIQLNESLGAPTTRALDALFARIDAEPARRRAANLDFAGRFAAFIDHLTSRTRALAAAVAGVLIVLQGSIIGVLMAPGPVAVFQTASAPGTQTTARGAFVLLRFAPQAPVSEVTSFLEANHASIASGPTAGGFYRVQVANAPLAKPALAAIVQHMQQDKSIEFVSVTQ